MHNTTIREPTIKDEFEFLTVMQRSQALHHPWVQAPSNKEEFAEYIERYHLSNQKSYLVIDQMGHIAGVFNISEVVRGYFQNAYLGFYAVIDYAGKGYMSAGLKLALEKIFGELALHRIEANIQPENNRSIALVKRSGFRNEGYSPNYLNINGAWRGHEHWAMTLEDYTQRQ